MKADPLQVSFIAHGKVIALVLLLLLIAAPGANAQSWYWAVTGGGVQSDKATDMDRDAAGNLYVVGYYNYDATFGPHTAPATFGKDGFLAKIDTAGNWQWLRTADGGWDERVLGMCIDNSDNIYVTGTCWYDTNFGSCPTMSSVGGADEIFVGKFNTSGTCQWLVIAGGYADDHGYDLVTDDLGNIYLTGFISDEYMSGTSAYFGNITVPIPFGDSIAFVAKMEPVAGAFQWVRTFPATDGERDNRIAIDASANVYITGGFEGTKTFGTTALTSAGGRDVFVTKYSSSGNFLMATRAGGPLDDRANSIVVDDFGDVYVTGEFRDKAVFGTDTVNNHGGPNGRDIFVAKMKQNGSWVWAKRAGSTKGGDRGNRIIANKAGHLFVTGQFNGEAHFGSDIDLITTDSVQAFVACMDTTGKWKWALQGGGAFEDRGNALACDDSCNVYNAGYYKLNATFGDDNIGALGAKDVYVAKIVNACPEPVEDTTVVPVPGSPECLIAAPNVFSPNGDGMNESFGLKGSCISDLELSIYNRWGNKFFTASDDVQKWDGKHNGKEAEAGVYYYIGQATLQNGEVVPLRGFFTLLR